MRLRIKGLNLSVSFPALCLFSCVIIVSSDYSFCMLSVFVHEAAHITAMLILNRNIKGIKLSAFDVCIIEGSRHITNVKKDLLVIAAGPFINIFIFIAFYHFSVKFAVINLCIGLFNLLPAISLDGGQILFLLLKQKLSEKSSVFIIDIITIIITVPLFFVGIILLLNSKYNFSLLFISLYLILSLFLKEDKYL